MSKNEIMNKLMILQKVKILRTLGIDEIETSLALNEIIPQLLNGVDNGKAKQIIGYLKYESFYISMSEDAHNTASFYENCTTIKRRGGKLFMQEKLHNKKDSLKRWNPSYSPNNAVVKAKNYTTVPFTSYGFIYFLMKDKQVVYVGQTEQPLHRIHGHSKKDFNAVCLFPSILDNRKSLEVELIKHFRPKYNKAHNPDYVRPKRKKKTTTQLKTA